MIRKRGMIALSVGLLIATNTMMVSGVNASTDDSYKDRFLDMHGKIMDTSNGYFSPDGVPYHSIETLMVEAPDYGHVTTSEAMSYYVWLEAMYGKFSSDFTGYQKSWDIMDKYLIPQGEDQKLSSYNPNSPVSYAAEWETVEKYPSTIEFDKKVGVDPIGDELKAANGNYQLYGMHWILDVDNWYGFGNKGDGTSKNSYFNTFQRGEQESAFETIPQPAYEAFKWGGANGYLDLFTKDKAYAKQWKYTDAPDADARAVQASYWANVWAKESGKSLSTINAKAAKMGDSARYSFFDKYFMKIGGAPGGTPGTGYDSAHYLISWYYGWGGALDGTWSWREGCSHNYFGYQNPMAAWVLSTQSDFKPKSTNGAKDWGTSLKRQIEFYTWLQSSEGGIAGGATNSWNGRYEAIPSSIPTFYGMGYVAHPVYADPPSNRWFGMQAWSMQRVAEYYYATGDVKAEPVLKKWAEWVEGKVKFENGSFQIPSNLGWTGQPDTWNGTATGNSGLHVTVDSYGQDLGVSGSLANTLLYWSAGSKKYSTQDTKAFEVAQKLIDCIWDTKRDAKGVSSEEQREDYRRILEQELYVPSGYSGKMPNGDAIKPGVKFIDIRSKYKQDPDWSKMVAYQASGFAKESAPKMTYHRFWHEADYSLALGTMAILFPEAAPGATGGVVYGDANNDKKVDSADYTLLRSLLLRRVNSLANPKWETAMDLNQDKKVDSADYTLLRSFLLGKITKIPV